MTRGLGSSPGVAKNEQIRQLQLDAEVQVSHHNRDQRILLISKPQDRRSRSRNSRSAFIINCSVTYLGSASQRSTATATASSLAIRASAS